MGNIIPAWRKARKGKISRQDIVDFDKDIEKNLLMLHNELKNKTYSPKKLVNFILRDPKTRKISKADFRDRVVHHSLMNIIAPIFEKGFIYDSCAGRIGKGTLLALQRFEKFFRIVSNNCKNNKNRFNDNNFVNGYCLKADIKQYFPNIDHSILLNILKRKIKDENVIWLIQQIINANSESQREITFWLDKKGIPLGNYTSQFFANLYLNELDQFVKHKLKIKYYIRYVDDFVIFHKSKEQLEIWKDSIDKFLKERLKIELHPQKSRIIPLSKGVDFVGFRNFANFRLLRKRNIRKMNQKISLYKIGKKSFSSLKDSYQGWQAYARWANTYKLREETKKKIIGVLLDKI